MTEGIKEEVLYIYNKIKNSGFEVYLVGGCVRNLLMKIEPKDWDLATNARPEQIQLIFPNSFYDNKFGTVGVPFHKVNLQGKEDVNAKNYAEITTFRHEKNYKDLRHPEHVEWGETILEDLARRDFTVNAIAMRLTTSDQRLKTNDQRPALPAGRPTTEIIDPYNGQGDIKSKTIRAVGNPDERFKEDALRLMRAVRFAAQHNFIIEEHTQKALGQNSHLIKHVSYERIKDELFKILISDHAYEGLLLLDKTGILEIILPEVTRGKGLSQARPGRHHTGDVFTHSLLSVKFCPSGDPIVRLATLIHDIGKPNTVGYDENNLVTFYNHEVVSSRLAKQIAERLKLSNKERDKIFTLVRWHMFTVDEKITDSAIRRFIRRVGFENVKDIIDLRIGDRLGSGVAKAESWRLKKFKERIEQQLHPPFSINDMAVDGHDVMKELNINPGPLVGKILETLFKEVDEDLTKNNREYLIKRIRELV